MFEVFPEVFPEVHDNFRDHDHDTFNESRDKNWKADRILSC